MMGSSSSNPQFLHKRRGTTPTRSSSASSMATATETMGFKDLNCYCGRRANIRVSNTNKNPGRHFYCCYLPKDDISNCKFFAWVEQECDAVADDGKGREDLWRMRLMSHIDGMQSEIRGLKYIVTFMCLCLLMLVIVVVMFIKIGT